MNVSFACLHTILRGCDAWALCYVYMTKREASGARKTGENPGEDPGHPQRDRG